MNSKTVDHLLSRVSAAYRGIFLLLKCPPRHAGASASMRGFTLVEILIALAIISVAGGSIMSALNASSKTLTSVREITTAESLTRTQTEYIRRSQYDSQRAETTLSADISASDDEDDILVASTAGFLPSGVVCIDNEIIQYDYKTGSEFRDCTRGVLGTSAAAHNQDARVVHDPYPSLDGPPDGSPGQPVYIVDPDIVLAGEPYYGEYQIEVEAVRLDPEGDGYDDDDGIQEITVKILHKGRLLLATSTYKADK